MKKLALILGILVVAAGAYANLLENGNFDTGDGTGWTEWDSGAEWGGPFNYDYQGFPCDYCDSIYSAFLSCDWGSFGLLQVIDVVPGYETVLSGWVLGFDYGANWYELLLFDGEVDGDFVDHHTTDSDIIGKWDSWGGYLGYPTAEWESASGSRMASGDKMTVAIKAGGLDVGAEAWFDCLDAVQPGIPEPGTMMLLGTALLGLAGLTRRIG